MFVSRNRVVGLILFFIAITYLFLSFRLPPYPLVPVDSDAVPIVLGVLLTIFSIILFFTKETEQEKSEEKKVIPENKKDLLMLLTVAVFIFLYIWLLEIAGFILTTILFIFFTTLLLGYKRHMVNLIVSVSVPVVFYYIFSYLLEIALPKGFLPF
ncbi:tripartite tricarboxylate transporter TctB family protein [Virgibacillus sp. C22-A2]|uniref:Tripartite tricarboxylate transporter TctB family protein n=1 Tax=Virgibacillus tibetensis TaxID=3042313 RepID=A0ABU6KFA1_9BACI|nr:tripartite tricarboxylate transporter TctB family protein [Virgibacillus sp. C22-A2]